METLGRDAYEDKHVIADLARMSTHIRTATILGRLEEFYVSTCTVRSPKHFTGTRRCVFLHDYDRVVAMVGLGDFQCGMLQGYDVRWVGTHPDFRGRALAMKLYVFLITKTKTRIWSGGQQTPNGRRLWLNLSKAEGVSMRVVSPKHIDRITQTKTGLAGKTRPLYNGSKAEDTRIIAFPKSDPIGPWLDKYSKIAQDTSLLRKI